MDLSAEQLHYAVCDAYVPLILYHELSKFSMPRPLPKELVPSMPVLLYNSDNTVLVAKGHLLMGPPPQTFDSVKLTAQHTIVEIAEVFVSSALFQVITNVPSSLLGPLHSLSFAFAAIFAYMMNSCSHQKPNLQCRSHKHMRLKLCFLTQWW